jgi:galactokinase
VPAVTTPYTGNPPLRLLVKYQERFASGTPEVLFHLAERDLWIAGRFNDRAQFSCLSLEINPALAPAFTVQSARQRKTVLGRPLPRWSRYPAGVIIVMSALGYDARGFDGIVCADEPPGPRYEYGLGLLYTALVHELNHLSYNHAILTEIVDHVQREYVDSAAGS